MANMCVRDVLTELERFHGRREGAYEQLAHTAGAPRVRLLAGYLGACEAKLLRTLQRYKQEPSGDATLSYWFKVAPIGAGELELDAERLRPDISVEALVEENLRLDAQLGDVYARIAERTTSPRVRELFENLRAQEDAERRGTAAAALETERDL